MYYNGTGVPQDHAEAARLYRPAANQGLAESKPEISTPSARFA